MFRKHFNVTSVIAIAALVFAMSGGAYAAGKYLITSTKQISPKVLKSLAGKAGKAGAAGAQGSVGPAGAAGSQGPAGKEGLVGKEGPAGKGEKGEAGPQGAKGEQGSPWTAGGVLPKNASETGSWQDLYSTQNGAHIGVAISFPIPLKQTESPVPHYITLEEVEAGKLPAGCKGTVAKPEAEAGRLCVFEANPEGFAGVAEPKFVNTSVGILSGSEGSVGPSGGSLTLETKLTGLEYTVAYGTWAVAAE